MGQRRLAREAALQLCYQIDVGDLSPHAATRAYWQVHSMAPDAREFAEQLVFGVHEQGEQLDQEIEKYSAHWRVQRMAAVDRNVLRLALYELQYCADIPVRVTLNEAIELGKRFGSEESGAFINGILDHAAQGVEKPVRGVA